MDLDQLAEYRTANIMDVSYPRESHRMSAGSDTDIEYDKTNFTLMDDIDASFHQPNNEAEQMLLQVVGVLRTEEVCHSSRRSAYI